ncbi:MAG: class I SAM-dependent methyltransferase [Candidatus Bathyarchaeia archaeon]
MIEHYYSKRPTSHPRLGLLRCRLRGGEFEFLTASSVFSHRRIDAGTRLLIEAMRLPGSGEALDIGCGYGPIGIVAAKLNSGLEVWMTDVNERAVALAKENARRNRVGNVRVLQGSLYEPVEDRAFDVILTNPPISAGLRRVVEPLIEGSVRHLKPGGSLQVVVRTTKGGGSVKRLLERYLGGFEVVARKSGYRVLKAERS